MFSVFDYLPGMFGMLMDSGNYVPLFCYINLCSRVLGMPAFAVTL